MLYEFKKLSIPDTILIIPKHYGDDRGFFLETYKAFNDHTPTDFMVWAKNHYDRDSLTNEFHSNKWYDWFVDKVLNRE